MTEEELQTIRRALVYYGYNWPKHLTSGVMFYEGQRITIEQFNKENRRFK